MYIFEYCNKNNNKKTQKHNRNKCRREKILANRTVGSAEMWYF